VWTVCELCYVCRLALVCHKRVVLAMCGVCPSYGVAVPSAAVVILFGVARHDIKEPPCLRLLC